MAEVTVGGVGGSRRQIGLLVAAVGFMLIAVGGFLYLQYTGSRDRAWADLAKEFSTDAESMERAGRSAQPDFATLGALADDYDQNVKGLREGDSSAGISKLPGSLQKPLDAVATSWNTMHTAINDILANEKQFGHVADNVGVINDAAAAASTDYEQIANHMGAHGAPSSHIFLAASQQVRLEQIKSAVLQLLNSGRDGAANAQALNKLAIEFNERQSQLLNSSAAAEPAIAAALTKAGNDFAPIATAAATISQDASGLAKLQTAAAGLQANATDLIANAKSFEQALLDYNGARGKVLPYVIVGSGIAAVLSLLGFVALFFAGVRERLVEAESRDSRQQQAILNLLDEITNLANGDLTVDVTVTEDFTGAIADSINYTVQTLRGLVGTINSTSEQIVAAAASTQDTAQRMSRASDRQAREVSAAASSITTTSQQLQDVAGSAERLAVQAQTSVQVAHGGAATVGRTIQNMAALREQIQDTAKRIKRLGESSQEIGNIIEFINDIAEQTNTLALNASIQAAMAGEAGRGFAVVADEVQRLAERAGSATRQIETLVKTIQADTNEAIISMERSTANVVAGAKSAEEAGQSLTRIESSSQELAKLIQDISVAAKGQSAEANKIAGTMQGIREIAVQTSGSANTTAQAIGELNALSDKLRESVAGFKLPEGMETPAPA